MQKRNQAIDIFRFFCAVLVIAIHTRPILMMQSYIPGGIQILVRIAVPFFFCVTGYFLEEAVSKTGLAAITRTFKKTFSVYLFWSLLYFGVIFAGNVQLFSISSIKWLLMDFFINGSYYHLWYIVAVLWSMVAYLVLCKLRVGRYLCGFSIILYFLGLLGTSYYQLGSKIPGFSVLITSSYFTVIRRIALMGFPFILLGMMISKRKDALEDVPVCKIFICLVITAVLFVAEILVVVITGIAQSIVITIFLYPLVALLFVMCLKQPLQQYKRLGAYCRSMANTLYFIHPLIILVLGKTVAPGNMLLFILTTVICLLIGVPVAYCKQRVVQRKAGALSYEK